MCLLLVINVDLYFQDEDVVKREDPISKEHVGEEGVPDEPQKTDDGKEGIISRVILFIYLFNYIFIYWCFHCDIYLKGISHLPFLVCLLR